MKYRATLPHGPGPNLTPLKGFPSYLKSGPADLAPLACPHPAAQALRARMSAGGGDGGGPARRRGRPASRLRPGARRQGPQGEHTQPDRLEVSRLLLGEVRGRGLLRDELPLVPATAVPEVN